MAGTVTGTFSFFMCLSLSRPIFYPIQLSDSIHWVFPTSRAIQCTKGSLFQLFLIRALCEVEATILLTLQLRRPRPGEVNGLTKATELRSRMFSSTLLNSEEGRTRLLGGCTHRVGAILVLPPCQSLTLEEACTDSAFVMCQGPCWALGT